jgi:hypothetical protein
MALPMLKPDQQRWYERPWNIFWVALGLRIVAILIGHTYRASLEDHQFKFGYEAGRIARSVALGRGYSSPFNGDSGPSAWLPPLFTLLMAAAFKVFGVYTKASAFVVMAADSVFSALIAPAVYEIGRRCFDADGLVRRRSGMAAPVAVWSAWVWAVYPAFLQYAVHWLWEMSLSTCLLAWALVVALRLRRVGEADGENAGSQWGLWAAFGMLWGLEAQSNTTLLIVLPFALAWVLWPCVFGDRRGLGKTVAGAVLSCLLVGAVMTPWIVRNERVMHAFIPARSNFGIEFWNATEWSHGAFPWGTAVPLSAADPEFKLFARMGEVKYAKMRSEEAKANIRANPGEYVRDTALRTQFFWFIWPHPMDSKPVSEEIRQLNYGVLSVTGLLGLLLALRRRVRGAWLMFWVMMLIPLPYYLVTVQARFRHPMEPVICVLTVYLLRATEKRRLVRG